MKYYNNTHICPMKMLDKRINYMHKYVYIASGLIHGFCGSSYATTFCSLVFVSTIVSVLFGYFCIRVVLLVRQCMCLYIPDTLLEGDSGGSLEKLVTEGT